MFANQSSRQADLHSFHEISLRVLNAVDACLESDMHKQDRNRPCLLCWDHRIIATCTRNAALARNAYDTLIAFQPEEAEDFRADYEERANRSASSTVQGSGSVLLPDVQCRQAFKGATSLSPAW